MKRLLLTVMAICLSASALAQNPLLQQWNTPFEVPPFSTIENDDYVEAMKVAIEEQNKEISAIVDNPSAPTFQNTILAYDNSGALLSRVASVFYCIAGTEADDAIKAIQRELSPLLTAHSSNISLNEKLFLRIKSVYERKWELGELEARLTDKIYKSFERGGANLSNDKKEELRKIDQELAMAQLTFGNNLNKDNGDFVLNIRKKSDLKGLPQSSIDAAAGEAKRRGLKGWAFTLDKPSLIPFLQYSEKRDLRKEIYTGYLERANNNNETDNKEVIRTIANLRLERAKLLGFENHSDFVLDQIMAGEPERVYELLDELWQPALDLASKELAEMKALEGAPEDFQSWDWWYWAERLREAKYSLNEEELRPYFELNAVRDGIFKLTTDLFGLKFKELKDIEVYNASNQVFEVTNLEDNHIGVLYLDFHPRPTKRVGAWCTSFRGVSYKEGHRVAPIVSIVCNFTPPASEGEPALLNLDEVETFFHEFGHAIHSLVSEVQYKGLRSVERDFVELPSQIMENWAFEPEVLATYAHHYKTGELMPKELMDKIERSALFNQGFATTEYVAASLLDMNYHTITSPLEGNIADFEADYLAKIGLIEQIAPRYRSTYFQHIFAGGYSSGYYSYIWAEVLDADAYAAFVESGDLYNKAVAKKFLDEILKRGGTKDGNTMYYNFRGQEPSKEPLMRGRGLL